MNERVHWAYMATAAAWAKMVAVYCSSRYSGRALVWLRARRQRVPAAGGVANNWRTSVKAAFSWNMVYSALLGVYGLYRGAMLAHRGSLTSAQSVFVHLPWL